MGKRRLAMSKKLERKLGIVRLTYYQPELYSFGSIEQVQSYYQGAYLEGPDSQYWYS